MTSAPRRSRSSCSAVRQGGDKRRDVRRGASARAHEVEEADRSVDLPLRAVRARSVCGSEGEPLLDAPCSEIGRDEGRDTIFAMGDTAGPIGPVGMFDSGVGGLAVLAEMRRVLPREDVVYYADSMVFPY